MNKIDQLLARLGSQALPPAPQILTPLLNALRDEDTDLARLTDLISFDPALTVNLLSVCNSTSFGLRQKIDSVVAAVHQLGFRTVYRIVATTCAKGLLVSPTKTNNGTRSQPDPWRHAVLTAFAAQFVAEDIGIEPSTMFTAGLLHDLGRVVLMRGFKMDYLRLLEESGWDGAGLVERESETFGMTGAEVGGDLLALWQFIPPIVSAVRYQDNPMRAQDESGHRFAACLHLSNQLALSVDEILENKNAEAVPPPLSMFTLRRSAEDMSRYQVLIRENMKFIESMCRSS